MKTHARILCAATLLVSTSVSAQEVNITTFKEQSTFVLNGQSFSIERDQNQDHMLTGEFSRTSRACPPFCIQPMQAAAGVETVGELEVLDFLEDVVSNNTGLLVDSRLPEWFSNGTIPGAVNVPFATLDPSNPYRSDILRALGATDLGSGLDFSNAMDLMLFCNGPWCEQATIAINNLVGAGYPTNKIFYYRGGMQSWLQLGLTVTAPNSNG
ncbi:rhodanese-like domain-containing protein [Aestuariibius sp. HNIBRBA575]|uniref:rhodanese-like domain-containing protein n=1 Tax=Aestuariibius sp. HNIBRBA575 TaxID=3233343 RepID=UPI0034A4BB36